MTEQDIQTPYLEVTYKKTYNRTMYVPSCVNTLNGEKWVLVTYYKYPQMPTWRINLGESLYDTLGDVETALLRMRDIALDLGENGVNTEVIYHEQ